MAMACSYTLVTRGCPLVPIGPLKLLLICTWLLLCQQIATHSTPSQLPANLRAQAMRSVDRAFCLARAAGNPFPSELGASVRGWSFHHINDIHSQHAFHCFLSSLELRFWLQGDNCPKEVRNSFTGKFGCLLAQANYFVGVSHHHMVVGHTHEDIGWGPCYLFWSQDVNLFVSSCSTTKPMFKIKPWPDGIFSLITSCLNAESCIETPRDIQRTNKKPWQFLWLLFSQSHWWPDFYDTPLAAGPFFSAWLRSSRGRISSWRLRSWTQLLCCIV